MDYSLLTKAPLFSGMTQDEIRSTLEAVPKRIRRYTAGMIISHMGDQVSAFMMVVNGLVKGEMVDFAGRVIKIEDIPAPGAIASAFIFGGRNSLPVNVIAIEDTTLLIIDKYDFLKLLKSQDKVLINFLDMVSNRSQFLSEKIKFLNFKTIKGKIAQFILQKAVAGTLEVTLDMTQNDLAEFFGVTRPSIGRAFGELEDEGLIFKKGKHLKILDRKGLTELTD